MLNFLFDDKQGYPLLDLIVIDKDLYFDNIVR